MTNKITNKDKIRIEVFKEFEDVFTFTSNKVTPIELREVVGEYVREKVLEILFTTGEEHLHLKSLVLKVNCTEDCNRDDSFDIHMISEIEYLELESDNHYKDRIITLKREEDQLRNLANKFGYELKKIV